MGNQVTEMTGTGSVTRPAYAPFAAAARPATEPRYRGTILAPVGRLSFTGEVCPSTGGHAGSGAGEAGRRVVAGMCTFQGTGLPMAALIERDHDLRVTAARSFVVGVGVKPLLGDQFADARPVPPVPGSTHERPPV